MNLNRIFNLILLISLAMPVAVLSQQKLKEKILSEGEDRAPFEKKFRWGVNYNQYWSSINGDAQAAYFLKPSIGGGLRAEYYFTSFLGVGLSAGYQQRGAGINHTDVTGGAFSHPWAFVDTPEGYRSGDPDSTHLERLRFNTIEFPLTLLLRTPKDLFQQGMRLSAAAGPTLVHVVSVNQTFQSIVDGFHPYNYVTDNYITNDLGYQLSIGAEFDSGGGGKSIFQVHFVYTQGTKNIFAKGQADGRLVTYGVRLSWLF